MLRYTARNGTTFHFDPDSGPCVQVFSADSDGSAIPVDLEDMREFMLYVDDQSDAMYAEMDADLAAVGPD